MANRVLLKIITPLAIIIIVYLVYINNTLDNTEIVTIYPEQSPTKVRPQENGGMGITNSNNIIYENLQQKKVGKQVILQPEPEKPLNIIRQKMGQDGGDADSIDEILSNIANVDKTKDPKGKANIEEKGSNITTGQDELIEQKSESVKQKPNITKKIGLNVIKVIEKSLNEAEMQLLNTKAGYTIQLASVKSELEAQQEGYRIKKKYAKILNNAVVNIKRVRSNKGYFFYLVLVGNYKDIGQAKNICKKLSDFQQGCIITSHNTSDEEQINQIEAVK